MILRRIRSTAILHFWTSPFNRILVIFPEILRLGNLRSFQSFRQSKHKKDNKNCLNHGNRNSHPFVHSSSRNTMVGCVCNNEKRSILFFIILLDNPFVQQHTIQVFQFLDRVKHRSNDEWKLSIDRLWTTEPWCRNWSSLKSPFHYIRIETEV